MKLKDKVAIITASGSGMGRAGAILFAKEGAKVVVADLDPEGGEETVRLVRESGGEATFVKVDVSKLDDLRKMVKTAVDTYGKLNILWNHAGIPTRGDGLDGVDEKSFSQAIDINLRSGMFGTKYAVPEMAKAGGGAILFTATVGAYRGHHSSPMYSITKAAVLNMNRTVAKQVAKFNIRSNVVSPGPIDTPMFPQFMGRTVDPEANRKRVMAAVPLGRLGRPEEIAQAALFLVSDDASYITGTDLLVDGGTLA